MHARGAKVAIQLYHAGRYSNRDFLPEGCLPFAPSAIYSHFSKDTPVEMTRQDIKDTIQNWADAAVRAKRAGFDLVEIIGCGGYLINQFLSPLMNQRTDEYGGSFENRMRFPLEVIRAVREAVGQDYPLMYRIAGNDFVPNSNTSDDILAIAGALAKENIIDLYNVTGGWHETVIPQLTGEVPRANFAYLAAGIRNVVNRPVIASNRMNDPAVAEETLALGKGDFIGMCRPAFADPDWPNKVMEDRVDEIKRCVACNQGCLARVFFREPAECLVNGSVGREHLFKDVKPETPKRVLVVGGGPGGCEFAIKAAEYGHTVTLWEKQDRLGGQLHVVCKPHGKADFGYLPAYYATMLRKHGVTVELNKTATVAEIRNAGFDEVVVATGSSPKNISLPVADSSVAVVMAEDILTGNVIAGKDVLVVGGGSVGCETALKLALDGAMTPEQLYFMLSHQSESLEKAMRLMNSTERNVTIVEIAKKIGAGFDPGTFWPVQKDMKRLGVGMRASTAIRSIANGKAVVEQTTVDQEGVSHSEVMEIPCDTVVVAVGYAPENTLVAALDGIAQVHAIGDAKKVGKIIDAIRDAENLAAEI
jgi:NADH:flavin oxidoreductases, Old Yellow Enzyme family